MNSECQHIFFSFSLLLLPPSMTPPPTTSCQIECTRIESLPFIRMHSNMWVDSGMNGLLYVIGYCVCSNCGLWEIRSERPTSNGQIKRSSRFFFMHALCCAHELIGSMDANKIIHFFCVSLHALLHYSGINLRQCEESDWFIRIFIGKFIAWENRWLIVLSFGLEPPDCIQYIYFIVVPFVNNTCDCNKCDRLKRCVNRLRLRSQCLCALSKQ